MIPLSVSYLFIVHFVGFKYSTAWSLVSSLFWQSYCSLLCSVLHVFATLYFGGIVFSSSWPVGCCYLCTMYFYGVTMIRRWKKINPDAMKFGKPTKLTESRVWRKVETFGSRYCLLCTNIRTIIYHNRANCCTRHSNSDLRSRCVPYICLDVLGYFRIGKQNVKFTNFSFQYASVIFS